MSRRQSEILNFILEDVFYALIAFRVFADVMVENTWLESLKLVNEALYHAGRAAFAGIVCILSWHIEHCRDPVRLFGGGALDAGDCRPLRRPPGDEERCPA